jgi:molybdopterin-guanine dinucleotide biosynthesis protein A
MNAKAHTLGVVIAGGRSVRFGGEKAVAEFEGTPLLMLAARRLQPLCARVAVNARPGSEAAALAASSGLDVLHDLPGDPTGPLAGVRAGLAWARAQDAARIAVSPCDSPLVPEGLFERLLAQAGEGAAMAVTDEGRQPQFAIWPVSAYEALTEALAAGEHPATWRMLESIGAVSVPFGSADAFANVNTREELAALAARAHQR